ncbi:MAG: glycosyltransferase [Chloroflexota bacterium]
MSNLWRIIASITFLGPPLAWQAERQYQAIPKLTGLSTSSQLPSLSIIIPSRNEAENLQRLLPSLLAAKYPGPLEVIVVDDSSTDATAEIATSYDVRVVQADPLPDGWLGKPHACHRGVQAAQGEWILFTDADTVHAENGPAQAMHYIVAHELDGLSLFLHQETQGLWDRLALLVAFAGLFAGLTASSVVMNGQYILLRRDVYLQSQGFEAVCHEPLEDLALGHHLANLGYKVPVLRGESAAQVAMYHDGRSLWQGLTRLGAGSLRYAGLGSLLTVLFITATMTPILTLLMVITRRLSARWLIITWLTVMPGLLPWANRFGSPRWVALTPFGALLVQVAATWGLLRRLFGKRIQWKGRSV